MDFLPSSNISLYTVPAALLLAFLPGAYGSYLGLSKFDPAYPRTLSSSLANDESISKETKQKIIRAKAASDNAWETLGFYAAAVAAANAARVDPARLNALSLTYVAARLAFNFAYVTLGSNRATVPLRTLSWMTATGAAVWLFIEAAGNFA